MTAPALQRFALNFWTLTVSKVLYRMVSVGVAIYLARSLGAGTLGAYATVMNVLTLYLAFADLGVTNLVIRDVSRNRQLSTSYLDNFFALQFLVGLVLIAFIMMTGALSGYEKLLLFALAIGSMGPFFSGLSNAYQALMNAHELFYPFAVIEIVCMLVFLVGNVFVVILGEGLIALVAVTSLVSLVKFALGAIWAIRFRMRVRWSWNGGTIRSMLRAGLPFLLINGTHYAIQRMDVLFLSWTVSEDRVGMYAAASRLIFASLFLVASVGAMLYPVFSRLLSEDAERAEDIYARGTVYMFIAGAMTAMLFYYLAPLLTLTLYGEAFRESATILQMLSLFIPLFSFGLLASNVLMVSTSVWKAVLASVVALCIGVAISPWCIATWEIQGAAVAILIAEAVATVLYIAFTRRELRMRLPWGRITRCIIAMMLPMALLHQFDVSTGWIAALAAFISVSALLLILRVMTFTELRSLVVLAGIGRRTV